MKILFVHQNYPAQFGEFASYLGGIGWDVWFITAAENAKPLANTKLVKMKPHRDPTAGVHRFARGLENAMINGQAFANAAIAARGKGLNPDIVVAHSGWGSGTFAKAVWPDCKYVSYVEWYYRYPPLDQIAGGKKAIEEDGRAMALARNTPSLLDLTEADLVFCPTYFQADQFPADKRNPMVVMHDGVNTRLHAPNAQAKPPVKEGAIPDDAEIISYITRGMEPHRGFPEFMRALAVLQKRRPNLYAIIGGEDRVSYGPKLAEGDSWKKRMLAELDLDESRIVWPGLLPRRRYVELLQSTHVHVYLTVPFVLSWSLIEAMAIGCPLVVSDTAPVREAMEDGTTGHMVDHNDVAALTGAIESLLSDRDLAQSYGKAARIRAVQNFSSDWIWPWRAKVLEDLHRFR